MAWYVNGTSGVKLKDFAWVLACADLSGYLGIITKLDSLRVGLLSLACCAYSPSGDGLHSLHWAELGWSVWFTGCQRLKWCLAMSGKLNPVLNSIIPELWTRLMVNLLWNLTHIRGRTAWTGVRTLYLFSIFLIDFHSNLFVYIMEKIYFQDYVSIKAAMHSYHGILFSVVFFVCLECTFHWLVFLQWEHMVKLKLQESRTDAAWFAC